jgi:3-hydroxyisobutyrate dehydrogenase-like beta-hydroxyacid dehydrogenase
MSSSKTIKVGFIGPGQIGTPMAARLIDGGHALAVYDVRPEAMQPLVKKGAKASASPHEMADQCEVVIISLPNVGAFRAVIAGDQGIVHGKAAKYVINTCTVGMKAVREMADVLAKKNIVMVDCPISGGVPGAAAGTLSVMVSGDPAAVKAVHPYIQLWGTITVAGDKPGAAQALKLTNNILSIVALAATSEAYVMGAKAGLDPEVMTSAINVGSGRNSATLDKFPRSVLNRSFHYGSAMHILMKDADLAIELGEELGVPMWVCQAARLVYKHVMFAGAADDDVSTIVQHIERAANFQIPKTR